MDLTAFIREVHRQMDGKLNEKMRRLLMAAEASAIGRGGISMVARANNASRVTIKNGQRELLDGSAVVNKRIRRKGGGGKKLVDQAQGLWPRLTELLRPHNLTEGPCVLQWADMSLRRLSIELRKEGYIISHVTLGHILEDAGFTLQANRKTVEKMHPDERDAQFEQINNLSVRFLALGYPVIVVNLYKQIPGKHPAAGQADDGLGDEDSPAINASYAERQGSFVKGPQFTSQNQEGECVGVFRDTASFTVSAIRNWWVNMGSKKFAHAKKILIIADGGSIEGAKSKPWRAELKLLAQSLHLEIHVSHFPPGTTKWCQTEHYLWSRITSHYNDVANESTEVSVQLIAAKAASPSTKLKNKATKFPTDSKGNLTSSIYKSSTNKSQEFLSRWNYIVPSHNE